MVDPERSSETVRRSPWRPLVLGAIAGLAIVGLLAASFAIGHNRGRASAIEDERKAAITAIEPAEEPAPPPAPDEAAVALFDSSCGGCHTLAAAGTTGTIGPSLDDLRPTVEQVLAAIAGGGSGTGQMPAGLLEGADAVRVAELVAELSGN